MAQGPNYNVILPFTTTAGIAVPSTIVVGGLTVNGNINAVRFVALTDGVPSAAAFGFSNNGTTAGMYLDNVDFGLKFAVSATTIGGATYRSFAGGPTSPAWMFGSAPGTTVFATLDTATTGRLALYTADATTSAAVFAQAFRIAPISSNNGLLSANGAVGFVFDFDGNPAVKNANSTDGYAATWDSTGQYFCKAGVYPVTATTTITPSTARSNSHITNLNAGVTTLFITLPNSTGFNGLQYTISNASSSANTVVVSPQAADTLNVFGLTKAAGASVAASAAFSSITFHCITSTQWLATDIMGTWV